MASKKGNSLRDPKAEALVLWERLEINPEMVQKHPQITPILVKSLGKISKVIDCLRGSSDKVAIEIVRLWDLASAKERKIIPFEGFCLAAKSNPKDVMGIIMKSMVEQANAASELMLAAAHTEVVQKTIKLAKTTQGAEARKIILQNRGVMAAPKNQVFNNFGSVNQDNRKQVAISVGQLAEDEDKIGDAVEGFNAERMLKASTIREVEVIDVLEE